MIEDLKLYMTAVYDRMATLVAKREVPSEEFTQLTQKCEAYQKLTTEIHSFMDESLVKFRTETEKIIPETARRKTGISWPEVERRVVLVLEELNKNLTGEGFTRREITEGVEKALRVQPCFRKNVQNRIGEVLKLLVKSGKLQTSGEGRGVLYSVAQPLTNVGV